MTLGPLSESELLRAAEGRVRKAPWRKTARPEQLPPADPWDTWAYIAGRGTGKTRTLVEWIHEVAHDPWARIALVGSTAADARKVLVFGESGILETAEPGFRPEWHAADLSLVYPNGARADLYSAEVSDRLRGPQHSHAGADEVAAWMQPEALDMLRMGLRLGKHPKLMVTTTPRPLPHIRELLTDPGCVVTRGKTWDNEANLPAAFIAQMHRRYDNTRLGLQELEGEILDDAGALWTPAGLNKSRVPELPELLACAVGVDPSAGDKEGNDDQGIGVCGAGADGHLYVFKDATVKLSPAGWGNATVMAAIGCTPRATVYCERNAGGDMAAHVIRVSARDANIEGLVVEDVLARSGKHVRAEPVAALFEQGRAHIVGMKNAEGATVRAPWSEDLEAELICFTSLGYTGKKSPNRSDGMIWAALGLMGILDGAVAIPKSKGIRGIMIDKKDAPAGFDASKLPDAPEC